MVTTSREESGLGSNAFEPTPLSENAKVVMERRIAQRNDKGDAIESSDECFRRVAHNLAEAELKFGGTEGDRAAAEESFYRLMASLDFLPNSPTLVNAGHELQQLSACFVLPVPDSIDGIFEAIRHTAIIHKSGGGTGFAFSRLRPANDRVQSTMGVASGPVSFMKVFDAATEAIKQGMDHGDALIQFTLTPTGEVKNITTVRASHPIFGRASARVVGEYKCQGQGREVTVQVPFSYKLE